MKNLRSLFLWEQKKTNLGYTYDYVRALWYSWWLSQDWLDFQIVDELSVAPILDDTERSGINATHSKMVKIVSRNPPGYTTIAEALMRYCQDALNVIEARLVQSNKALATQDRNEIAELLSNEAESFEDSPSQRSLAECQRPPLLPLEPLMGLDYTFDENPIGGTYWLMDWLKSIFAMKSTWPWFGGWIDVASALDSIKIWA